MRKFGGIQGPILDKRLPDTLRDEFGDSMSLKYTWEPALGKPVGLISSSVPYVYMGGGASRMHKGTTAAQKGLRISEIKIIQKNQIFSSTFGFGKTA